MRAKLYYTLLILCLLASVGAYSQKRTSGYKNKHKPIRITPQKAKVICPIFEESAYPYHGFGFKVGDPVALTYKLYLMKKLGIAVDVGSASSGLYHNHHRENFDIYAQDIAAPDDYPTDVDFSPIYLQHKVNGEYVFEGKVLYQLSAEKFYKGLQAYLGLGWQYRSLGITYDYYYYYPNSNQRERGKINRERLSQGPEIVWGIEYSYFKIPVSAFLEFTVFDDLLSDVPWYRFQGGIGIRYVF